MESGPTTRGWWLLAAGVTATGTGMRLGSPDLVRIGLLALLAVAAGVGWVLSWRVRRGGRGVRVARDVSPARVHAGDQAQVRVEVTGGRLGGLKLAEQAAGELTGPGALRAEVRRADDRITVSYRLRTRVRGRWWLGPLQATRTDPLGVALGQSPLGARTPVAVWPAVVDLPTPGDVLVGEPDQTAPGVRSPSPDDAALRDYREGDDLRRVHWTSTARRGQVMVRSDEHTGTRPVTVLVGLPTRTSDLEWTLSLAASMALAALGTGHRVRILGTDAHLAAEHVQDGAHARAALLDPLVDLALPGSTATAASWLRAGAEAVGGRNGEIVLAVLGAGPIVVVVPGARPGREDPLRRLPERARCWAVVRDEIGVASRAEARADELRRAGWHATVGRPDEDMRSCWLRMRGDG